MIALPDSLALGSQACCALLTRKPECHRGGREHAPRREAGGARGHCAWRPTSRGQWARPLRSQQPRAEVARAWPCIRHPHPTLHRFCVLAGGGGSAQCLVWTQGDASSLSPLRGPFVSRWLMWPRCGRTPAFGQGRKFLLRAFVHCLLSGLALGRLLIRILFQRRATGRKGSTSLTKQLAPG